MKVEDEPRFAAAIEHLRAGDWLEAADLFEELYFEAVGDEVEFVRMFLQIATGLHHVSRGQRNAAIERLEEGLRVIGVVREARGFDLDRIAAEVRIAVTEIRKGVVPSFRL